MSLDREMSELQKRAVALIKPLIPPDAKDRVARAIKQYNQAVRSYIRSETGLRLSDDEERGAVPISIVEGFPTKVARLIDAYRDQTLWRLIMAQPKLGGVMEGLELLLESWDDFERWPELPDIAKGSRSYLERTAQVAIALQVMAITRKVFEDLREIHEDVLGAYRFGLPSGSRVEIYWMAHALFAAALGVRIEDLTVVTLAHELAHAYTHLGRDIDGQSWADHGFGGSDPEVIEGLAQFYAAAVAEKLLARAPGVLVVHRKLLSHQSGPYRAHEMWFSDDATRRGEVVRFAMLRARSRGDLDHAAWFQILADTRASLRLR